MQEKSVYFRFSFFKISTFSFIGFFSSLLFFLLILLSTNHQLSSPSNEQISASRAEIIQVASPNIPLFSDATLESGIDFLHFQGDKSITGLNEVVGPGVCVIDYNGDGWQDLFVVGGSGQTRFFGETYWWQGATSSKLFKNMADGTFSDVTQSAGLSQQYWGMGCSSGDLDNDGDPELLVTTFSDNYLYRNNGDGSFSDISKNAGIQGNSWSTSVSLTDYDKDGLLDIYVLNYLAFDKTMRTLENQSGFKTVKKKFLSSSNFDSASNILYKNTGNLTFKDVTHIAQIDDASGRGLSAVWTDLNNDQYQDLIIGNDENSPNTIFINLKNGTFVNASNEFKFSDLNGSNGIATADLNNDAINDIVVSGDTSKLPKIYFPQENTKKIFGSPYYIDQAYSFIQDPLSLSSVENWTIGLQDFNNDGFIDIFFANGLTTPDLDTPRITVGQKNMLLLNQGGQQLINTDNSYPFSHSDLSSRGAVFFDYDNDGDIDIFVANNNDMARLYRNDSTESGNWVSLKLVSSSGSRNAIGAKAWLTSDNLSQFREITSGSGFLSNSSNRLHFGLGNDKNIRKLKIQWPNGKLQKIDLPNINRAYIIKENNNTAILLPPAITQTQKPMLLTLGATDPVNRSLYLEILWNTRSDLFYEEAGKVLKDTDPQVRYTLTTLLASKKSKKALTLLLQQLDDNNPKNLMYIIKAIAKYEDEQSIRWLLHLLSHSNESVRLTIVEQFIYFFNEEEAAVHRKFLAIPHLIHLLSDHSLSVKLAAIKALGRSESYRAIFPLLKLLKDSNADVQAASANALGHIRERKAVEPLLALANSISVPENVRAQAFIALKRMGYDAEKAVVSLLEKTYSIEKNTSNLGVIYNILTDDIDGIILDRKFIARSTRSWLLKKIDWSIESNSHIDSRTYFFIANLIPHLNSKTLTENLASLARHKNPTVRLYAYLALFEYRKNNIDKTSLLGALKNETVDIRSEILLALEDFKISINIPKEILDDLLTNKETIVRLVSYYEKVFNKKAGKLLVKIASDNQQPLNIRYSAITALASKPYLNESLPAELLQHDDRKLRHLAINYWSFSQSRSIKWLKEKPDFMLNLERISDYMGIIETCRNRREAWAKQALISIINNLDIMSSIRQHAVKTIVNSEYTHNTQQYSRLLKSTDELVLQTLLKHANLGYDNKYTPALRAIFFNKNLLPTTRLLAAKQLKNETTDMIKTLTIQ